MADTLFPRANEAIAAVNERKASGQPAEAPEHRRQFLEALSISQLSRLANRHGVSVPSPFNRENAIEALLHQGLGEPEDVNGM